MIPISIEFAGAVIVNAVVACVSWGFLRRDVTGTPRDVGAIAQDGRTRECLTAHTCGNLRQPSPVTVRGRRRLCGW